MQISAIDTHVHCWNPRRTSYSWLDNVPALNRSFMLDELEPQRLAANVSGGVLIQAANSLEDTDWMLEMALRHEWIKGIVGWLPLSDPAQTDDLICNRYVQQNFMKGIRHLIHDEPDSRWLLQPQVLESLQLITKAGLAYDFVGVKVEHLETALELSSRLPNLRMVFDHLNQPPAPSTKKFSEWASLFTELAGNENLCLKISGLGTATGLGDKWTAEDIKPGVSFALNVFGEDRCFCGGDWPVSLLAGSYAQAWSNYRKVLESLLDKKGQEKVLEKNARAFYKLDGEPS